MNPAPLCPGCERRATACVCDLPRRVASAVCSIHEDDRVRRLVARGVERAIAALSSPPETAEEAARRQERQRGIAAQGRRMAAEDDAVAVEESGDMAETLYPQPDTCESEEARRDASMHRAARRAIRARDAQIRRALLAEADGIEATVRGADQSPDEQTHGVAQAACLRAFAARLGKEPA